MSIPLVQEFMQKARSCSLEVECLGDGNTSAEIAIVSEYPGENEVRLKAPLVGGSGKFLWDALRKYNITRPMCYVTNVIKRRVVRWDQPGKSDVPKLELEHWQGLLQWELQQLPNLKYVLVLGNGALEALVGQSGITQWRGSVMELDELMPNGTTRHIKYVIANNPAHILRSSELEPIFGLDMYKFNLVHKGDFKEHHIKAYINPTPEEALAWIDRMEREGKPVSADIETIARETACVGLANDPHEGMCISFRGKRDNTYSVKDEIRIRMRMAQLFANRSVKFVAQNGMFDASWMWWKDRIKWAPIWHDTMLAHHTLYPLLPHNLGFIVSQYTTHPYYKDEKDTWKDGTGNIDQFWNYNVKDACLTLAAAMRLDQELKDQQLDQFFYGHVMREQPHLIQATIEGIKCDTSLKDALATGFTADVEEARSRFLNAVQAATGERLDINPGSHKQVAALLYDRLGIAAKTRSVNEDTRNSLRQDPRTPDTIREILNSLDEYAEKSKFLGTYANMTLDEDQRLRGRYNQAGVVSAPGRLSSAMTYWDTGMNQQNQPERARAMFTADDGQVLFYFDLEQAEARYVAYEARIASWIEQFEKARLDGVFDCHRALAADMFEIPYDEVPIEDRDPVTFKPTLRYVSKRCRHGLNYRMAADRLATVTGLPLTVAQDAYNRYHRITPELRIWWSDLGKEVRQTRELYNCYGRRLKFLGRIDDTMLDSIVAYKPQSSIGDKVRRVMYMCHEDPEWPVNARILQNGHDSLIGMAPESRAMRCLAIMKKHAEEPVYVRGEQLIIPAGLKISVPDEFGKHRWSNMKKVKL